MESEDLIKAIENVVTRDQDWFYHAFFPEEKIFTSMLREGIKCRKLLTMSREYEFGHNGNHYISLSKMETNDDWNSSYWYYEDKPAFVINGVKARKCTYFSEYTFLEMTRWPFRYSMFIDEYQAYKIITPDYFVGLRCSVLEWYQKNYEYYLKNLKQMIELMKEYNINLPIYDYTRAENLNVHLLDQDAYLELFDDIIDGLIRVRTKK